MAVNGEREGLSIKPIFLAKATGLMMIPFRD